MAATVNKAAPEQFRSSRAMRFSFSGLGEWKCLSLKI
jgi:hypothetical protein